MNDECDPERERAPSLLVWCWLAGWLTDWCACGAVFAERPWAPASLGRYGARRHASAADELSGARDAAGGRVVCVVCSASLVTHLGPHEVKVQSK